MPTMNALLFDRPSPNGAATRVGAVPAPQPGAGEVLIEVACAGINFKDVMARRGDPGYAPVHPFTPGVEATGTVTALGAGVTDLAVGDTVAAMTTEGALAEFVVASAALVVPLPPGADLATTAGAIAAPSTAVLLYDRIRARGSDVVLVHSASGAVGRAFADVARARDAPRLIGVVGADARVQAAVDAGYRDVLVRDAEFEFAARGLARAGVDAILDPQGTSFLAQDRALLRPGGHIVLFGNASGAAFADPPAIGELYSANASIGGFSLAALSTAAPDLVRSAIGAALDLHAAGALTAPTTVLAGLEAAPTAHDALAEGRGAGKYVVRVR